MKSCPINGCANKEGLCIHKKMMLAVGIVIVFAILAKIFGWF